jgi:hypothetical protein
VTHRKSGPVQRLGNNLSAARIEDEIAKLFTPFGRLIFPFAFSPSAIVSA